MTFCLYTMFRVLKKLRANAFGRKALAFCKFIVSVEETNVVKHQLSFVFI